MSHIQQIEYCKKVKALSECYRILKENGAMFFTIPIIHEKLTRKRHDLKNSYHGNYLDKLDDFIVYTEYGADFYTELIKAGFRNITLNTISDLSSLSITCQK